jgi:hypothetical protein
VAALLALPMSLMHAKSKKKNPQFRAHKRFTGQWSTRRWAVEIGPPYPLPSHAVRGMQGRIHCRSGKYNCLSPADGS